MNNFGVSKRGELAPASPIRKLAAFADQAEKDGVHIYHLNIGQPDLVVPKSVEHRIKNCSISYIPYENSHGMACFIDSWRRYYEEMNVSLMPRNILVTSGGSEAISFALAAVCDHGDEVVCFEPLYANYLGFANFLGIDLKPICLDENYHLPKMEIIEHSIGNQTRAILLNNPNNPTGTVFSEPEIKMILKLAKKKSLYVICDEAYLGITFDGKSSKSILQIADESELERIIVVDSVSKRLNACGLRVGILVTKNLKLMDTVDRFAQARLSAGMLDQWILADAPREISKYSKKLASEYQKRRDAFIDTFEAESGITVHRPEGAFYAFFKIPVEDTDHFAKWLLTDFRIDSKTVMVAPGAGFYASAEKGKDEIRVAYVLKKSEMKKAAKILAAALKTYNSLFPGRVGR
ncbi:MAG: pyridoxal phosphate-dependent aminotransferase [Patescibacteria group bacterium]